MTNVTSDHNPLEFLPQYLNQIPPSMRKLRLLNTDCIQMYISFLHSKLTYNLI